jgi:SAM-dependent methyltransferase
MEAISVDKWKYYGISHRDHDIMNPSSLEKLDQVIRLLRLPDGASVVDIGCGKAEPLARIAEAYNIQGSGVDLSPYSIADARKRVAQLQNPASRLELLHMDGAEYQPAEPLDLAICLGASWIYGGYAGTLARLASWVKPRGLVLTGEPYWRAEPPTEYLEASNTPRALFATHRGNVELAKATGLIPLYTVDSSLEDWDRYVWLQTQAIERYALEQPDDPDVPDLLARSRKDQDLYLRWERDYLGWCIYLYLKP